MNPYGCNGNPRPVSGDITHLAQRGWGDVPPWAKPGRYPLYVEIRHVMSTTCQYDKRASDPRCVGCNQVPAP